MVYPYKWILLLGNKKQWTTDNAMTWINLRNIMLSERSQKQKTTHCMILFICNSRKGKTSDRKQISSCEGQGMEEGINIRDIRKLFEVIEVYKI